MSRALPNLRFFARRTLSTSARRHTAWSPGPSPPRLPRDEQEIFEQLQRESTGAFSTPRRTPQINQSPQAEPEATQEVDPSAQTESNGTLEQQLNARVQTGDGEELHPNIRRGAAPEFEGDVNPKTGEAGGPKNEPLRWGHSGDWSYNGRATDF